MIESNRYILVARISTLALFISVGAGLNGKASTADVKLQSFGQNGAIKMLYDRRQGPASVYLDRKVYLVYHAQAELDAANEIFGRPIATIYDPETGGFSRPVILGPASKDHHHGPVIWPDRNQRLQVLAGCHKTPGIHLVSRTPKEIGEGLADWTYGRGLVPRISYPRFFQLPKDRQLIYYRTDGHNSSWTYRISDNNGRTWEGPERDVTDLDSAGRLDASSYHSVQLGPQGRFLHVAFVIYDDNKAENPIRFYNPRYKVTFKTGGRKRNLYYLRIDLETGAVTNDRGKALKTPIHLDQANAHCRVWDTDWRFTGLPPGIAFDRNDQPVFLHALSGDTLEEFHYYIVRNISGKWEKTRIAKSNHAWNNGYLRIDESGTWQAYLVTDDFYLDSDGAMDRHGGGRIEEWRSDDGSESWRFHRDLMPDPSRYAGWRFNNIQPVTRPNGQAVDGMLLFYGWPDSELPRARGFLMQGL